MSSLYHIDLSPYHHKNLSGLQAIILLRPLLPAAVKELSVYDIGQVWIEYWILVDQILKFCWSNIIFFIGPRYTWGPIYGSGCLKLTHIRFWNLTELTLPDEDTNSILTDNANRAIQGNVWNFTELTLADEDTDSILTDNANWAIQGNVAMQVTQHCGQLCKQWKWHNLVTKFWTNTSCATWGPNLQLMQVVPHGGQICNQCK